MILDGEIVAWRHTEDGGHAMPFTEIQKRLGRKQVSRKLMTQVPVAYVVFDVLYAEGELTLQKPLIGAGRDPRLRFLPERSAWNLSRCINAQGRLLFEAEIAPEAAIGMDAARPTTRADSIEQLEQLFAEAMARGNEGLMIKDVQLAVHAGPSRPLVAEAEARTGDAGCCGHARRVR